MAKEATAFNHSEPAPAAMTPASVTDMPKRRKASGAPRKPSQPRDVYAVLEILSEDGQNALEFPKNRIRLLGIEKDAKKVLELIDGSEHPNALYVHGKVAPGR